MSYIISYHGTLVAKTSETLKSGAHVTFGGLRVAEEIDASREWNLINGQPGKISNAKKWAEVERRRPESIRATQINDGEFFLD